MQVIVNGEDRSIEDDQTIGTLLHALQIEPDCVAVEMDRRIVKKAQWNDTKLRPGAKLEIVQFVGGG